MKLAVIFRGPVRPTPSAVLCKVDALLECLRGHEVVTHLWTWQSPAAAEIVHRFDHCHLLPEPDESNAFKQFWTLRQATMDVQADFVIQSRTDILIRIDINDWLIPGQYTTIHARGDFPNNPNSEFINDQFGVATPEIMRRTWDYKDEETLRQFLAAAKRPEDVFQSILDMNTVPVGIAHTSAWDLDKNRHDGYISA